MTPTTRVPTAKRSTLIFSAVSGRTLRRTRGYKGEAFVNGRARDLEQFMSKSSFTMQNDRIQPRLTVMESMRLATWLKYRTAWHNDVFLRTTVSMRYCECLINFLFFSKKKYLFFYLCLHHT